MKVRSKILAPMLALSILSVTVTSILAVYTIIPALENEDIHAMEKDANNLMSNLSTTISDRISEFKIITYPGDYLSSSATTSEKIEFLKSIVKSSKSYITMSIYDTNGIEIADTMNIGIGDNASNENFYKEAIRGKIYHGHKPEFASSIQKYVICISGPIYNNGKISGVVMGKYPLDRIYSLINPIQEKTFFDINLISDDGTLIYSSVHKKDILNKNLSTEPIFQHLTNLDGNKNQISNDESYFPNSLVVGVKRAIYSDSDSNYWVLLISRDRSEAFSLAHTLQTQFMIFGTILTVFVAISVLVLVQKFTNPLKDLTNASNAIANGNLNSRCTLTSNDEFGDLGHSFNIMADAIQKSAVRKDEFLAMMTHELKTPLVPIQTYVELLLSENLGTLNEAQKQRLRIVASSSQSLLKLISDLLDAQKLELGHLRLDKKIHNMSEVINDVIVKMKPTAEHNGIIITTELEPVVYCLCDRTRMEQVLANLISNSLDFVPKSTGIINVKLESQEGHVHIIVRDNGKGIDSDNIKKIFVPFYQIDSSSTREHGGTGLGLVVCKGIIENHGGRIWIESQGLGKGTEFHIILPMN